MSLLPEAHAGASLNVVADMNVVTGAFECCATVGAIVFESSQLTGDGKCEVELLDRLERRSHGW
jgi:hypothetical protein